MSTKTTFGFKVSKAISSTDPNVSFDLSELARIESKIKSDMAARIIGDGDVKFSDEDKAALNVLEAKYLLLSSRNFREVINGKPVTLYSSEGALSLHDRLKKVEVSRKPSWLTPDGATEFAVELTRHLSANSSRAAKLNASGAAGSRKVDEKLLKKVLQGFQAVANSTEEALGISLWRDFDHHDETSLAMVRVRTAKAAKNFDALMSKARMEYLQSPVSICASRAGALKDQAFVAQAERERPTYSPGFVESVGEDIARGINVENIVAKAVSNIDFVAMASAAGGKVDINAIAQAIAKGIAEGNAKAKAYEKAADLAADATMRAIIVK